MKKYADYFNPFHDRAPILIPGKFYRIKEDGGTFVKKNSEDAALLRNRICLFKNDLVLYLGTDKTFLYDEVPIFLCPCGTVIELDIMYHCQWLKNL